MLEDLPSDAELIKHEIKKSGIQFIDQIVETREGFIQAIQNFNPDVILSDYSLPNFNGMQALVIRAELAPSTPFILVTGSINEETAVEVMKFGADDYLIKEHIVRLGEAIRTAIEKKEIIHLKNVAEEKLKVLQRAVEQNPASIIITNIKGEIEYVNPKFTQLTGYSLDDALGQNPRILKSGTTTPEEYKRLWEVITSGNEWHGEFRNRKKNGEFYYESASISPITDEKGNITHFLAVKEDITERKQVEEALSKSQKEFQNYFNSSSVGLSVTSPDKIWIEVNQKLCDLFGYTKEELIGLTWEKLSHPEDLSANLELFQQALDGKIASYEIEKRFIRKNGSIAYVILSVVCEHNKDGSVHHFLSSYIDITRRKQSEEQIKTLSKAIEQSPTSIIITNAEGKIEFVNAKFTSLMQYSLEDVKGKNPRIFNPGHAPADMFQTMWETLQAGSIWQVESMNRKKDGLSFRENVIISPLMDDYGRISNYIIISEDITEKKEIDKKLKLLAHSLESIGECVSITDTDDIIFYVNESFQQTYGYTENELIGKHISMLRPLGMEAEYALTIFQETRNGGWRGELVNRRKDGTLFPILLSTSLIKDENDITISLIGVAIDITERKKLLDDLVNAKVKAEESDRLKTAFLHNISHEIRTPMNAIVGFSEFLTEPDLSIEKRNHFIDIIVQSSDQLLSIITDIISISTIEAGQEKIREKEVNINRICNLINDQFQARAQSLNVDLHYNTGLADNEANFITDETKLIQILTNLVGNALKFTKQGSVDFRYEVKGNQLEFYVKDTGIGIPPEMHNEIFNRFRQVETTSARQFGGSGLGLSISKAYVELLGGKIWLTSEPEKGSTFYFTLPLKAANSQIASAKQSAEDLKVDLKKLKTILIAEDQDSNFQLLEELLSGLNVNIVRAINGLEAVEISKIKPINLILMDIKMPEMDGYEATKLIKEFSPNIPIIAQTAYAMNEEMEKALQAGCDSCIIKPFKKIDLLAIIKKYGEID